MVRNLVFQGNPILRQIMPHVEKDDVSFPRIIRDLWDTLTYINAGGLAANQIGERAAICIVKIKSLSLINPIITYRNGTYLSVEGCYSLPGYKAIIPRSKRIKIIARKPLEEDASLISIDNPAQAAIVQHEMDHLEGIMIDDYVTGNHGKKDGIIISSYDPAYITATTRQRQLLQQRGDL